MRELFALALAASILGFGCVGLLVHSVVCLVERTSSVLKRYTAKQLLVSVLALSVGAVAGAVPVRVRSGSLRVRKRHASGRSHTKSSQPGDSEL